MPGYVRTLQRMDNGQEAFVHHPYGTDAEDYDPNFLAHSTPQSLSVPNLSAVPTQAVVNQARVGGRDGVIAVVLGRGAEDAQVEAWLQAASKAKGVEGFAIGRTIFHDALVGYIQGQMTKQQAVDAIAEKYLHFYQIFLQNK
jgi:hypothetical protein